MPAPRSIVQTVALYSLQLILLDPSEEYTDPPTPSAQEQGSSCSFNRSRCWSHEPSNSGLCCNKSNTLDSVGKQSWQRVESETEGWMLWVNHSQLKVGCCCPSQQRLKLEEKLVDRMHAASTFPCVVWCHSVIGSALSLKSIQLTTFPVWA